MSKKQLIKKLVEYDGNEYYVCKYIHNGNEKLFVIDSEDLDKLETGKDGNYKSWHNMNGYVGRNKMVNREVSTYYLHNTVMNKNPGGGKGQKFTYDHINRNPRDNRKKNLREATQTQQNENQRSRDRKAELPVDCAVLIEDLPKCVYFVPEEKEKKYNNNKKNKNNNKKTIHGARFRLELVSGGNTIKKDSTSSKEFNIKDKLEHMKAIILAMYKETPEIFGEKIILEDYTKQQLKLMKEYNSIINQAEEKYGSECIKKNLMEIKPNRKLKVELNEVSKEMYDIITKTNVLETNGKNAKFNQNLYKLKITPNMIPKYCRLVPGNGKNRAESFLIEGHPLLSAFGKRSISTSQSTKISLDVKYIEFLKLLDNIDKLTKLLINKFGKKIVDEDNKLSSEKVLKLDKNEYYNKLKKKYIDVRCGLNKQDVELKNYQSKYDDIRKKFMSNLKLIKKKEQTTNDRHKNSGSKSLKKPNHKSNNSSGKKYKINNDNEDDEYVNIIEKCNVKTGNKNKKNICDGYSDEEILAVIAKCQVQKSKSTSKSTSKCKK